MWRTATAISGTWTANCNAPVVSRCRRQDKRLHRFIPDQDIRLLRVIRRRVTDAMSAGAKSRRSANIVRDSKAPSTKSATGSATVQHVRPRAFEAFVGDLVEVGVDNRDPQMLGRHLFLNEPVILRPVLSRQRRPASLQP